MIPSALLSEPLDPVDAEIVGRGERRALRGIVTAGTLAGLQIAALGLAWDILWHGYIGRDRFLTPPHIVVYAGVALAVLLVAIDVALERKRTPRGIALAFGGLLAIVAAAPLDALWHAWYGIDVTLWAPFHLMGLFGFAIALLGLAYASAELAKRHRAWAFGVYLALASLCSLAYVFAEPALRSAAKFGASDATAILPAVLIATIGIAFWTFTGIAYARDSRGALAVIGLYLARAAVLNTLAPYLTRAYVAHSGIAYRIPGFEPPLDGRLVLLSMTLVPAAFAIALARERTATTTFCAIATGLIALCTSVWIVAAQSVVIPIPHAAAPLGLEVVTFAIPATALVAVIAGALFAPGARGLGRLLRAP